MKKIALFALLAFLIAGCSGGPEILCDKPYIQVGAECCLDKNDNKICDKDESIEEKKGLEEKKKEDLKEEIIRIDARQKIRLKETDLPKTIYMQQNTKLILEKEVEEILTIDSLNNFELTIFYEQDRFKFKVEEAEKIGSLVVTYKGVDPPKSGNYAIIYIEKAL